MSEERFNAGTLVDRNLEAGRGGKTAIRCAGEELTYAQLHDRVCRAGNALRALGVGREDRVLMILDDTPAFPALFLGAMRMGAVPVPVSFLDTLDNFRHYIRDSYARVVVGEEEGIWGPGPP
jgi:acyl-coenzyme A synthetase/AMP-(fatty) acid ligase